MAAAGGGGGLFSVIPQGHLRRTTIRISFDLLPLTGWVRSLSLPNLTLRRLKLHLMIYSGRGIRVLRAALALTFVHLPGPLRKSIPRGTSELLLSTRSDCCRPSERLFWYNESLWALKPRAISLAGSLWSSCQLFQAMLLLRQPPRLKMPRIVLKRSSSADCSSDQRIGI